MDIDESEVAIPRYRRLAADAKLHGGPFACNGDTRLGEVHLEPSERPVHTVIDFPAPAGELILHVNAPLAISLIATTSA